MNSSKDYKINIFLILFISTVGLFKLVYSESNKDLIPDLSVTGIFKIQNYFEALVNETIVKKGDTIEEARVIDITPSEVKFEFQGTTIIRKIGEGVVKKKEIPMRKYEINKETESYQKDETQKYQNSSNEDEKLYREAIDNYNKATAEDSKANMAQAYIYYEMAIKYAQWAYLLVNSTQRNELNKIVEKSRSRVSDLAEQKEKIESIKYAKLDTPSEISKWLKDNITYRSDWSAHSEADYWQTPKETIILKSGDCEDYAFLTQALLNEININSSVISIQYNEGSERKGHAICIFPKEGPYNCFSGSKLYKLNKWNIEDLVKELYLNWTSISELDLSQHSRTALFKRN